jgi:hypothetical protein
MKKLLLIAILTLSSVCLIAQTTATNFNAPDCAGTNHNLFDELDAGKVIVISFVMPCGSCIGPSIAASNKVKTYSTSNPGRVLFYLSDDFANTSCSSLTSWANTNGMSGVPVFSNKAVSMDHYGTSGMPKVVVLAGKDHSILFNQDNTINATDLTAAIDKGLTLTPNGISTNSIFDFKLELFPNPVIGNKINLNYSLEQSSDILLEVYNAIGSKEIVLVSEKEAVGKHEHQLNLEKLSNGIYFIKLSTSSASQTLKLIVSH